ncbi:hypothetical protein EDC23_1855 [Thiohalophilus thiocyanatoxydans]|uniref:Uncharacterized protein n=1 Tax=Thiohalophilus thiocyanatoxydans TaxID=381308 RepID=A0A4R8IU14_9GAMM|nr:hypothetical protein EDC23_1855 [Thiohalophilus thiocyanatoxydans]
MSALFALRAGLNFESGLSWEAIPSATLAGATLPI